MNIVKLQKQLQNVPDSALIGYVQNPDGQVPTYLALTEISRRKQMRDDYQQQAAPEKSVAEAMVEEATGIGAIPQQMSQPMPQQMAPEMPMQMPPQMAQAPQPQAPIQMAEGGLASLDLPDDMFSEESYASGGIVAFEDGGEVENYAPGGIVPRPLGPVKYETPTDYSGEYDEMLRPEISAQEAMAKYQGLMGTDVGRQKLNERLAAMETRAAKEEEQAPWMALAKAGLGMAGGRSQFAVQNIAEGAQAGLKDFADARERLANKEEKRFNIQAQLAQAERAEQVAAATYGLQSEEAVKARNEANRLAKLGYKANLASDKAKGELDASKVNLEADIAKKKIEEDVRWHDKQYDADMARTNVMGANAQFTKEQAQATNLLKQIMAPKIAALKSAGMDEEEAYEQVFPSALAQLPPNMLAVLGYNADTIPKPAETGPRKKPLSALGK
jgi:hypothetical protein